MRTAINLAVSMALLSLVGCQTNTIRCDRDQQDVNTGKCCSANSGEPCVAERGGENGRGNKGKGRTVN